MEIVKIWNVINNDTVFMVPAHTRIKYQFQVSGISCEQVYCEGYVLNLRDYGHDFDDCSYGCTWVSFTEKMQKELGVALDVYFLSNKFVDNSMHTIKFAFDWDRLHELKEGWWPVKAYDETIKKTLFGYIHTGNCD